MRYLGFIIFREGLAPHPSKTDKVQGYPVPTDVTQLRQFLGLVLYYRYFIAGFAKVAKPLHALTKMVCIITGQKSVSSHFTS